MTWKIVGAEWTRVVNILTLRCSCGRTTRVLANKRRVKCSGCGTLGDLLFIKGSSCGGQEGKGPGVP